MTTISPERLAWLDSIELLAGAHQSAEQVCAMEAAAYLAGEGHTDRPACVSPLVAAIFRNVNDRLSDEARQKLKPLIPLTVGTANVGSDEDRRNLIRQWALTEVLPLALSVTTDRPDLTALLTEAQGLDLNTAKGRDRMGGIRSAIYRIRYDGREGLRAKVREAVTKALAEKMLERICMVGREA